MMKTKRSIYNLIAALISQGTIMLLGLIIPKLTISYYGSETNGYTMMVSQVYAYIGLLEAGLSTAVVQALYAPVTKGDKSSISAIVNAARVYYRKIAVYYTIIVLVVSIVLPLIIQTTLSKIEMSLYFLLFGVSNIINFWFTASMRPLLLAEGKNYINSNITLIFHVMSQSAKILLLFLKANIVLLQLAYSVVNIIQIVVYYIFFKRNYQWLDKNLPADNGAIKQRDAFFWQQISNLIFSCTDVMLLSFFCNLKVASVYAVYMLIFNALSTILSIVTSSTQFILGQEYNSDRKNYITVHRTYEMLLLIFSFSIFTTAEILTIPFIKLYTAGVNDVNYIDYALPILFCMSGLLSTCKSASLCLINFSFHAKQTLNRVFVEAGMNLVISLILVKDMGIRGVLIGTCCALIYRVIDVLFYTNHRILNTSVLPTIKVYIGNFVLFIIFIALSKIIDIEVINYVQFAIKGAVILGVCGVSYLILNYIMNRELFKDICIYIKKII